MAITPDEIETKVFPLVRRGYDPAAVDDFLKDVAATVAQAQGGLATPPPPPPPPTAVATGEPSPDDYNRLGDEVAAILRQAHESVAQLRHRAEADAALIRQNAQREAEELTRRADADRQAAAIELEAAHGESDRILADVQRRADGAAEAATVVARERSREVIEAARAEARGAVLVQRNVRGRLEDTRVHIDQALDRLVEEDEDLFDTIDLTDGAMADDADGAGFGPEDDADGPDLVPPPGQGPPTPPVPPPSVRMTPESNLDLPYADEDDDDETLVVDLTDDPHDPDDDGGGLGAVPPDQPDAGGGSAPAEAAETPGNVADSDDDALSQMVKNAVENALRRRKGDSEPPEAGPA